MGLLDNLRVSWDKEETPSRGSLDRPAIKKVVGRYRRKDSAMRSERNENIRDILRSAIKYRGVKRESFVKIIWYRWLLGKSIPGSDAAEDSMSSEEKAAKRAEEREDVVFLPDADVKKYEKQRAGASVAIKPVQRRRPSDDEFENTAEEMRSRTHPRMK